MSYAPSQVPCCGDRPHWSWMNSGGIAHDLEQHVFPNEKTLLELALLEQDAEEEHTPPFRARVVDSELQTEANPAHVH